MSSKVLILLFVLMSVSAEALADQARVRRHRSHEVCFDMQAGQGLSYSFTAAGPLDFNAHYHEGAEVFYLAEESGLPSGAGATKAPLDQHYCLMWTNHGSRAVMLDFTYEIVESLD